MDGLESDKNDQAVALSSNKRSHGRSQLNILGLRGLQRPLVIGFACAVIPIALAGTITLLVLQPRINRPYWTTRLILISQPSKQGMNRMFHLYHYHWPPSNAVPAIGVRHLPGWLSRLPPENKKTMFFRLLLPLAIAANNRVRRQRDYVQRWLHVLAAHPTHAIPDRLLQLASKYQVNGSLHDTKTQEQLLRRCDTVPEGLLLAQAAKESGWGTSVFARTINNLFGIWTWQPDSGVMPADPSPHSTHRVRAYESVEASIQDYIFNLNVGFGYRKFRKLRAAMRAAKEPLKPIVLASTLTDYSQRRTLYVLRLQRLIINNNLGDIIHPKLALVP